MDGETELKALLAGMDPQLREGELVFCTVPRGSPRAFDVEPVACCREDEGLSLVMTREAAERAGLPCDFACRMITLRVHSSLHAVGLLAAVTRRLASAGIAVNAVSAYHHDHLFVPAEKADRALRLLRELSRESA